MQQPISVYIDLMGDTIKVGQLWSNMKNGRESCSFEYERSWLMNPNCFSLDPALKLIEGAFHASLEKPMFGAIEDSAPDRWGRMLMRRAERKNAEKEKRTPRSLREIDYLLMVDDEARQGALRFKIGEEKGFMITYENDHIPPLVSIGKLLSASNHILEDRDTYEDVRLLLAPGSSLGGARPKASVRDRDKHLAIAKFPKKDDEIDIIGWEAVALTLAKQSGIDVPDWRLETIGKQRVLISRRFDRMTNKRIPFLSAVSVLSATDNETHSYLEIADAIRQISTSPKEDLKQLWRRILLNVLISNLDDHLRNHAFLYNGQPGWRLSPVYDLNPTPIDIKPRILCTSIDYHDPTASFELVISTAEYYGLDTQQAKEIVRAVANSVAKWRKTAAFFKIKKSEVERMATAFEHTDFQLAKAWL